MKKLTAAGLALLIAVPAVAQAQDRRDRREWRDAQREFRQERREFRQERRAFRNDDNRTRVERREFRQDRREFRGERREYRDARREWRDDRRDHRGYSYNYPRNQYYYAPPRTTYYYAPSYSYSYPGYYSGYSHAPRWSRGMVLPYEYRRHVIYDYNRYGWGPPPRGYAYYSTDTGDIILAAIATGIILSIIGGGW